MRKILLRDALLLALAGVAGCVDAISYVDLGGVFTANMTGHAVLVGVALVAGETSRELLAVVAICGFFAGAVAGAWLVHTVRGHAVWPLAVTCALVVEGVLLACAAGAWYAQIWTSGGGRAVYVAACGIAMGLQSGAVQALALPGVSTTYVTGTLTKLAADVVHAIHPRARVTSVRASGLLAGIWFAYVGGAAAGALLGRTLSRFDLAVPAAAVLAVAAIAGVVFRARAA